MSRSEVLGADGVTVAVVSATVLKELIHSASLQSQSASPPSALAASLAAPAIPSRPQRASAKGTVAAVASGCDADMDSLEGVDFGYYDSVAPPSSSTPLP
jgi:hypothetical protein